MNGKREMRGLRIEGYTIAFDTEKNHDWNFTPRDIEYIIYNLQRIRDEAIEYCENNKEYTPRLIDVINILKGSDEK
jgi:hypothetical protein